MEKEQFEIEQYIAHKGINYTVGTLIFNGYEKIKNNALELAEKVKGVEVNQENIKLVKKELAGINKDVEELNDIKKTIKNKLLEPYVDFEAKIKEIIAIVKESDAVVRGQVRALEEAERNERKQIIEQMFYDKLQHYKYANLVKFDNFYKPEMSNKTTSVNKLEEYMSEWLESVGNHIDVMSSMDDRNELIADYLEHFNLAKAIQNVKERKEKKEKVINTAINDMKVAKKFVFIIDDEKDAKLVELLLKENKITYKKEIK